ncbi:MAG: 2-dehydropantoate 2-reductase [Solirubrobacterales bacterium]|nr:2-dehydropantoate 2-reductase [Solirubrobacterales bacterium]
MRFAVVGAGAIGAYVGAALARGGADVTLIARGAHLRAMQQDGVKVLSPRGDFHAHPVATDDLDAVSDAEVVFLGLKAHSLPAVADRIGRALAPSASVIAAQNGIPWWYFQGESGARAGLRLESVDPGGRLARAIAPDCVIGCVIYCSTEIVEPGVIRHLEGTRFAIGEPDGTDSERCERISKAFVAGGLRAPVEADLRRHIWLKLIGNAAFNPASALTGATLAQLGSRPDMVAVLRTVLEESAAVAAALGVELPVSIERRLEAGFAVGDHKTSMLQDLEAGRPLEVDCLTGAVIELGEQLDVPVPATRILHACTKLLDDLRASRPVGVAA